MHPVSTRYWLVANNEYAGGTNGNVGLQLYTEREVHNGAPIHNNIHLKEQTILTL
jgi:hypothetical protein